MNNPFLLIWACARSRACHGVTLARVFLWYASTWTYIRSRDSGTSVLCHTDGAHDDSGSSAWYMWSCSSDSWTPSSSTDQPARLARWSLKKNYVLCYFVHKLLENTGKWKWNNSSLISFVKLIIFIIKFIRGTKIITRKIHQIIIIQEKMYYGLDKQFVWEI